MKIRIQATATKSKAKHVLHKLEKKFLYIELFSFCFLYLHQLYFYQGCFIHVYLIIFCVIVPPIVIEVISSPIITPSQQQEDIMISWMVRMRVH